MAEKKQSEQTKSSTTQDLGQKELQRIADKEQEQGFVGVEVDQTPNENYTLAGVVAKAPTPETDAKAKEDATKGV